MSPSSTCEPLKHGNVQSTIAVNILTLFSPPSDKTFRKLNFSASIFGTSTKMVSKCVPKSHNWNPVVSQTNQNPSILDVSLTVEIFISWKFRLSVESPYIFRGLRWVHFRQLSYQWLNLKGGAISWCSLSSKLELKTFPEFLAPTIYEKNMRKSNWIMKPPSKGVFHMFFVFEFTT